MDFDELLIQLGEFGFYQKVLFMMQCPFFIFVTFVYFSQLFITLTPDHWCRVDELQNLTVTLRKNLSIPLEREDMFSYTLTFSKCSMYAVNYTQVLEENLVPNSTWPITTCKDWEYDFSEIPYETITSENNWVCDEATKPTIAQSVFFMGAITGGLLFGFVADNWGRVPALLATNILACMAGCFTALASNFYVFLVVRFIIGMSFDNVMTMMYILALEYVGPKWRTLVANLSIATFYTAGTLIVPWAAYYIRDWRIFTLSLSAPMAVSILAYWIVPESARWLISKGQTDKAMVILRRFEKWNGKKIDDNTYNMFIDHVEAERKTEQDRRYTFLDLLKTPNLRRNTIVMTIVWLIIAVEYDGHARNVGNLGFSIFITFTIASSTEFPADIFVVLTLDRWGRRWLAVGSLCLSGLFSFAAIAVPRDLPLLSATLAIFGRMCINVVFNIGLQLIAELLPTVLRAQGVSTIHIMGYVGSIVSPVIVYLAVLGKGVPLFILGALSIFGGLLCMMLPETLGTNLPNTLEDGEQFGKDQHLCDCLPIRKERPAGTGQCTTPLMSPEEACPAPIIVSRDPNVVSINRTADDSL